MGNPRSARPIVVPGETQRSDPVAAARQGAVIVAYTVWFKVPEGKLGSHVEFALLDERDRVTWVTSIARYPEPSDRSPAVAWGTDEIAVAWWRKKAVIQVALIDPGTAVVRAKYEMVSGASGAADDFLVPPAIAWSGDAYVLAWDGARGITLARVGAKGVVVDPAQLEGAHPALLPTADGVALAYDKEDGIWLTTLDRTGKTRLAPTRVATHPDPVGSRFGPVLASDGTRFAVAHAVSFVSDFPHSRPPPATYLTVVDPNGAATPPLRLNGERVAAHRPAVAWTGREWLVVYGRDLGQWGKGTVAAVLVSCLEARPAAH